MKKEKQNGVTLIILVITIVVMLIIAGITVYSGLETIKKANLESLKTNLLLIQAKMKEYVEEVDFKMGTNPDEAKREEIRKQIYVDEGKMKPVFSSDVDEKVKQAAINIGIAESSNCYYIPKEALDNMGLSQIQEAEGSYYLVSFEESNVSVEIYQTKGYSDNGILKHSLTDIDQIQ